MSAVLIVEQALNGLQYGMMLFLMAAGLTLVFGVMGLINLAHGSLYMVGAFACAFVAGATGSFWLGLVAQAEGLLRDTGLSERSAVKVAELSHGERRRLEIAMALALKPKAFLLDEPMAGMGAEGTAELTRLLDGLRNEAPILLVEHDMDAVFALADRITVLSYGRVLASGTVDEVRADPEVRAAYLGDAA